MKTSKMSLVSVQVLIRMNVLLKSICLYFLLIFSANNLVYLVLSVLLNQNSMLPQGTIASLSMTLALTVLLMLYFVHRLLKLLDKDTSEEEGQLKKQMVTPGKRLNLLELKHFFASMGIHPLLDLPNQKCLVFVMANWFMEGSFILIKDLAEEGKDSHLIIIVQSIWENDDLTKQTERLSLIEKMLKAHQEVPILSKSV